MAALNGEVKLSADDLDLQDGPNPSSPEMAPKKEPGQRGISMLRRISVSIFGSPSSGSDSPKHQQNALMHSCMINKLGNELCKFSDKWEHLSARLCERENRISLLANVTKCPKEVDAYYDDLQIEHDVVLDASARQMFYEEFFQMASGFDMLHTSEVEYLLKTKLGLNLCAEDIQDEISNFSANCKDSIVSEDGLYTFELYCTLICIILKGRTIASQDAVFQSDAEKTSIFPVDPDSSLKQIWDVLCSLLLLFCAFSVPYSIAFEQNSDSGLSPRDISDLCIDAIFMVDIALSFVTTYEDQGCTIRDIRKIAKHYLSTWFIPDFAGSFPFDTVLTFALQSAGSSSSNSLGSLKFIRMLRLVRAWKFVNQLKKLKDRDGFEAVGTAVTLATALFILIFSAHVLGCIFTVIMTSEPDHNWLLHYSPELAAGSAWVRYLCAMYWATITLTTMGYGDITPVTDVERCYVILVALVGAVIFSHCLGTISSLISQVAGVDDRFQARARAVQEYLEFRAVPADLRRRVKAHYQHCWRRSAALYEERAILDDLSHSLRAQLLRSIGAGAAEELPMLAGFGEECLGFIATRLRRTAFAEGEVLYQHGADAAEMHIIVAGTVTLHPEPLVPNARPHRASTTSGGAGRPGKLARGDGVVTAEDGEVFGELGLFPDTYGAFRTETAVARSWGRGYTLSAADMPELEARYPAAAERLRELCDLKSLERIVSTPPKPAKIGPAGAGIDGSGEGAAGPCRIQMRSERLRAELLQRREAELLVPATGGACAGILSLLRRAPAGSAGSVRALLGRAAPAAGALQAVSCVFSGSGELLLVEHSLAGIAAARPASLGFLRPGASAVRVLGREELAQFGGWGRRRIFGCALELFPSAMEEPAAGGKVVYGSPLPLPVGASGGMKPPSSPAGSAGGLNVELYTWSPEVFASLHRTVRMLSQAVGEISNNSCSEKASILSIETKDQNQSGQTVSSATSLPVGASSTQGEAAQCSLFLKPEEVTQKDVFPIPAQMHARGAKSGNSNRIFLGRDGPVEDAASNVRRGSDENFSTSIIRESGACLSEHENCLNSAIAELRQQLAAALERARFAELRAERLQRCVLEAIDAPGPAVPFPVEVGGTLLEQSPISGRHLSDAAASPGIDKIFDIF